MIGRPAATRLPSSGTGSEPSARTCMWGPIQPSSWPNPWCRWAAERRAPRWRRVRRRHLARAPAGAAVRGGVPARTSARTMPHASASVSADPGSRATARRGST